MHERTLGQGLKVSAIGLGAMGMSMSYGPNPGDRDDMIAVLRYAVEQGITFIDTAEVYGPYVNEELVGEAIALIRENVVVATMFGWNIVDGQMAGTNSRPEQIRKVAQESLRRLGVDSIDLFYQRANTPSGPGTPSSRSCPRAPNWASGSCRSARWVRGFSPEPSLPPAPSDPERSVRGCRGSTARTWRPTSR